MADLTTSKLLWNSILSTKGARYMCLDLKNFYLTAALDYYKYMKIPLALFPEWTKKQYNLDTHIWDRFVFLEIWRAVWGLPQAGILANKLLRKWLKSHGYYECVNTPGLWRHATRPITFSLVVDDFGIKYVGKEHSDHLKGQYLLHDIAQELLDLLSNVVKKVVAWPPANEHDGLYRDLPKIYLHRCSWLQQAGAYLVRLKAEASASNYVTGWSQVLKDINGRYVFQTTIFLTVDTPRSVKWCTWMSRFWTQDVPIEEHGTECSHLFFCKWQCHASHHSSAFRTW